MELILPLSLDEKLSLKVELLNNALMPKKNLDSNNIEEKLKFNII